ncbi:MULTISPECIES: esterase-like activity of phytase family protein [unclassified Okeania]|uniref:esterase-like activity of phytase family protein n=1 Tax=unclassified Okeania TaxID=2634635 RepID=UPI0013BD4838|nr:MULTISPECIES: esterase-like activity of phytase family protein [unclassified Okeania]NES74572.1 esterase-like activity of phytase family protein [Okeania sp. SIO1H4]NET14539.1 esterase-like activity of phytase family protein [Okeania sp. SIO1H6]NET18644.1 esterase-like activity of phytase family protein [Okeania sp. SIO1H5]NET92291.1 esterase-like activity of phytase family protein [Okeania sp. SIO1H2]
MNIFKHRTYKYLIITLITCLIITVITDRIINSATKTTIPQVTFLGEVNFPTKLKFKNTEVGGLSAITYNPEKQIFYAISDDRSSKAPARFYTLKIDLEQDKILEETVTFTDVTTLLNETGKPFPALSIDSEGIAFTGETLLVASEGDRKRQIQPFIREFSLTGKQLQNLPIPEKFLVETNNGVRNNLALESLTITPSQKYLFTATENALVQDGEEPTFSMGSYCRIIRYDLAKGQPETEFLYITEPIATNSNNLGGFSTNGLVDLLALDDTHLLSLERSFSLGTGNVIKLFQIDLSDADNIQKIDGLNNQITDISPVQKKLLLDFSTLEIVLDNIEGITFGPKLADGQRSLILVSDNNFNPLQITQILIFSTNL